MSGRQLFIIDNFRDTGRPLLEILADPSSIFIKGLAAFNRRILYANIVNDRTAVFYTCGVTKNDPYSDLDNVKLNYVEGYEPVILDPKDPVLPSEHSEDNPPQLTFYSRLSQSSPTINQLPLKILFMCLIPLGAVIFLLNAAVQTVRSSQRIRLHETGKAGIAIQSYREPFLIEVREAVEGVYENLNSAQSNEYLASGSEEEAEHEAAGDVVEKESTDHVDKVDGQPHKPVLALTAGQFAMIQALDEVGWRKYPVYIHHSRHSHAALIVRMNKPAFDEGWVVLRHWLNEEFLLK